MLKTLECGCVIDTAWWGGRHQVSYCATHSPPSYVSSGQDSPGGAFWPTSPSVSSSSPAWQDERSEPEVPTITHDGEFGGGGATVSWETPTASDNISNNSVDNGGSSSDSSEGSSDDGSSDSA